MSHEVLQDEIRKRFTLNWLIQGASQHAGSTAHYLVRDELNSIDSRLVRLYDQMALIILLQYWRLQSRLLMGGPSRFWKRAARKRSHPFYGHPLFSKYGGILAEEARKRAVGRCKEKGVNLLPFAFSFQTAFLIIRMQLLETPHRPRLIQLAKEVTTTIWGISSGRLSGDLVDRISARRLLPIRSFRDKILGSCVAGIGGVARREDQLVVWASGVNWHLLVKELVKGTAELVCLHGLNRLSDDTYQGVLHATDRLDLEPWMLQSGGELWRRVLAAMPEGRSLAEMLMQLARQPAKTLEATIAAVIERPESAPSPLEELAEEGKF
jgi:hypothetical protein